MVSALAPTAGQLDAIMKIENDEEGGMTINGFKIRVFRDTDSKPLLSIVDVLCAVSNISPGASRMQLHRLAGKDRSITARIRTVKNPNGGGAVQCADIKDVVFIVSHIDNNAIAGWFKNQGAETLTRLLGGDVTMINEIRANRERQEALAVENPEHPARLFGAHVEAQNNEKLEMAREWIETRGEQKESGKSLKEELLYNRASVKTASEIDNMQNQAVVGYSVPTKKFKARNKIRDSLPMAGWMNRGQLVLRDGLSRTIEKTIRETGNPEMATGQDEMLSIAKGLSAEVNSFAAKFGYHGFDKTHYEKEMRMVERAAKRRKTIELHPEIPALVTQ